MPKFKCACGTKHKFKQCDAIQTYFYVAPYGCTGGDYWLPGEIRIVCPVDNRENRILFHDYPRKLQNRFRILYDSKFKSISKRYKSQDRFRELDPSWVNNEYIYKNYEKYGLG